MTPRHARIALGGFFFLAAGVAINALFLQPATTSLTMPERSARVPAERARKPREPAHAGSDERSQRVARLRTDSAKADLIPEPAGDEADVETVRAIQRELAQRGYGPVATDGVIGGLTRAAIMAYEHDQGLALTGEASERPLKRILLGSSPATEPAAGPKERSERATQLIRSAQQALAALGYRPGRFDGQLGEETRQAIREFELDKGLVPKGRVSAEVMLRLVLPRPQAP